MSKDEGRLNSSTVVITRTHYWDDSVDAFLSRFSGLGLTLCVVADETRGQVCVPPSIDKISMTAAAVEEMGLPVTDDMGWRCGDYAFYLAARRFPSASFFWLLEPDDYFSMEPLEDFFGRFAALQDVDVLCAGFRRASPKWFWAAPMRPFGQPVYRCFYPVVRSSAPAIARLLSKRREMAESLRAADGSVRKHEWPNDEAFTATAAVGLGLHVQDLNHATRKVYSQTSFSFNKPFSMRWLSRRRPDGLIYHPVLTGARFEHKAHTLLSSAKPGKQPSDLLIFDRTFLRHYEHECGAEKARDFAQKVRASWKATGRSHASFVLRSAARSWVREPMKRVLSALAALAARRP